jgi:hypothetical protein
MQPSDLKTRFNLGDEVFILERGNLYKSKVIKMLISVCGERGVVINYYISDGEDDYFIVDSDDVYRTVDELVAANLKEVL